MSQYSRGKRSVMATNGKTVKSAAPQTHEYLRRLIAAQEKGHIPSGRVMDVVVAHDPDCPALRVPHGICSCNPSITLKDSSVRIVIGKNGDIVTRTLLA